MLTAYIRGGNPSIDSSAGFTGLLRYKLRELQHKGDICGPLAVATRNSVLNNPCKITKLGKLNTRRDATKYEILVTR